MDGHLADKRGKSIRLWCAKQHQARIAAKGHRVFAGKGVVDFVNLKEVAGPRIGHGDGVSPMRPTPNG